MTTKKKLESEISQIDQAIEWLEDFTANLKAGNTITKKAAKEFTILIDALSSLSTVTGKANTVPKKQVPYKPKGEIVWEEKSLPEWAVPRGKKK